MIDPPSTPAAQVFTHDAMHTTFTLRIQAASEAEARGMARECAALLERLESKLSRFIEDSDIARINRMQAGETLYLSEPCHQCLRLALDAHARTGGLFDITLGTRIAHRKAGTASPPPPLGGVLTLHPTVAAITCEQPGRELDLGGIGKGFALDQLRELLVDWGARGGLLAAGASTILAFGPDPWPVELAGGTATHRLTLENAALGASGTAVQGCHIVDPRAADTRNPTTAWPRVWLLAATAAEADAWSTAAILLDAAHLAEAVTRDPALHAAFVQQDQKIRKVGNC